MNEKLIDKGKICYNAENTANVFKSNEHSEYSYIGLGDFIVFFSESFKMLVQIHTY